MLKIKDNKESIFSPVKTDFQGMLKTFLYFAIFFSACVFLAYFLFKRFDDLSVFISEFTKFRLLELGIPIGIILPLALTVAIHKSFIKGLIILISSTAILLFIASFIMSSEEFVYYLLGFLGFLLPSDFGFIIGLLPLLLLGTIILGIFVRAFFRIKQNRIKIIIAIIPFLIILIIVGVTIAKVQNATLGYCDSIKEIHTKIRCYYNIALKTNNFAICTKIQPFADNNFEKCLYNLIGSIDKAEIDISLCEKSLEGKLIDTCRRTIGPIIEGNFKSAYCYTEVNNDLCWI